MIYNHMQKQFFWCGLLALVVLSKNVQGSDDDVTDFLQQQVEQMIESGNFDQLLADSANHRLFRSLEYVRGMIDNTQSRPRINITGFLRAASISAVDRLELFFPQLFNGFVSLEELLAALRLDGNHLRILITRTSSNGRL